MTMMPHIKLTETDIAPFAILPGDPARLDHIARFLEDVKELAYNREFRSISGFYKGKKVLAVSTGLGGPSMTVAAEELAALGVKYMIRIGSCGALGKGMGVGDQVLVHGAVRDDGASRSYIGLQYPAVADYQLLSHCVQAAAALGIPYHVGIVRTHDSFYIDEKEQIYDYWKKHGIIASDMETSALLVVGRLRGVRCASVLNTVVGSEDDLNTGINAYADGEDMASTGEEREILIALEAFGAAAEEV